jgi:hypothetical protein
MTRRTNRHDGPRRGLLGGVLLISMIAAIQVVQYLNDLNPLTRYHLHRRCTVRRCSHLQKNSRPTRRLRFFVSSAIRDRNIDNTRGQNRLPHSYPSGLCRLNRQIIPTGYPSILATSPTSRMKGIKPKALVRAGRDQLWVIGHKRRIGCWK